MTRSALALGLLLALTVPAHARTGPNPDGMRGPSLESAPMWRPPVARSAAVAILLPAPLPAGAVQLDSTRYDLQDLGSLGTRLAIGPDGRIHATWEDDFCELDSHGCPPDPNAAIPFPQRGMGYAVRDVGGAWTNLGKVRQPSIKCSACTAFGEDGGFGTIALTANGRAVISQHMIEDGCDLRGDTYIENAVASNTWTAYLGPISSPSFQFPQTVVLPNGSYTMLGEAVRVVTGCTHCGVNEFRISRMAAEGTPFTCVTGWQFGVWTSVIPLSTFRNGYPAFPCLAEGSDGRVGIGVTDFGGNVYLIESSDGTFGAGTVRIRTLTSYSDASITSSDSTSTQWRPYIHCHVAYNDTTPNVVWSELQARKAGSSIAYADWHSRIRHWSSTRGLTTVYQVPAGVADGYSRVDQGLSGPLAGFNTLSVDWPEVGFSADGSEIYVVWVRFTDAEVDPTANAGLPGICTGIGFGDLSASVTRAGDPWAAPQNLTSTPTADERYPAVLARNAGGSVRVLFQTSATNQAGIVQAQDRGTTTDLLLRRIAYLDRALSGSLVDVAHEGTPPGPRSLRSFPNPARGDVHFALDGARLGVKAAIEIFSVEGRRIARVPTAGPAASWNGLDVSGRRAPSGLYLARVEGEARTTTKFLLLR